MSANALNETFYLRAFRSVAPSSSLEDFLKSSGELAESVGLHAESSLYKLFAADSLRVVLYERRVRASTEASVLLDKLASKLKPATITATERRRTPAGKMHSVRVHKPNPLPSTLDDVERLYLPSRDPMVVRAISIIDGSKQDYRHKGTELALVIDPASSAATVLTAQADIILDASRRLQVSKSLPRVIEDPLTALQIPFMRIAFAGENEKDDFIDLLSSELPVPDIEIGQRRWQLKTD